MNITINRRSELIDAAIYILRGLEGMTEDEVTFVLGTVARASLDCMKCSPSSSKIRDVLLAKADEAESAMTQSEAIRSMGNTSGWTNGIITGTSGSLPNDTVKSNDPIGRKVYFSHSPDGPFHDMGFVPSGCTGTVSGDKLDVQCPEKANVGDVVQSKVDPRIQFSVGYVGEEYTFEHPDKRLGAWMLKHGDYTVVKRATCVHPNMRFTAATGVMERDGVNATIGIVARCDECGWNWVGDVIAGLPQKWHTDADARDSKALELSTAELVEALATREGVTEYKVAPYQEYSVDIGPQGEVHNGPARILVVKD